MKQLLSALLLSFVLLLLFANKTQANELSLGVYPPIIQINATPPTSIKTDITIQNMTEKEEKLKILLKPFTASFKNNGEVSYLLESQIDKDSLLFKKVQILDNDKKVESITLSPYETKKLSLSVEIEKRESLGDYYFSVVFITERSSKLETNLLKVPAGIATNVLLSVGEKGSKSGQIIGFNTPFFFDSGPVPFTVLLKNSSNHLLMPTGKILITNMFGQTVGKIDILPQIILSDSKRYLIDKNQASASASLVNMLSKLKNDNSVVLWPEKYLLGFYTAKLTVSLSENGPVLTSTTRFLAIPFSIMAGLSFILMIILGVYWKVRKRTI